MPTHRNAYDHRLRDLVCRTRDLDLAERLGVPSSTAKSWMRRGTRPVVTVEVLGGGAEELRVRVLRLERRVKVLRAVVRLLFVLVRMAWLRLDSKRLPDAEQKQQNLDGIARATRIVSRTVALRVLGPKPSRYHAWRLRRGASVAVRTEDPSVTALLRGSWGASLGRGFVRTATMRIRSGV